VTIDADSLFVGVPAKGVPTNQYGPSMPYLPPGTICKARYLFPHKDPLPCILVIGQNKYNNLQAINLRWLLPHFVAQTLRMAGGSGVNYLSVRGTPNILEGYRTYKVKGLRNVRVFDTDFMRDVLRSIQTISPNEIAAIRQEIERQLAERLNPTAASLAGTQAAQPGQAAPQDANQAAVATPAAPAPSGSVQPVAPVAPVPPTPAAG